MKTAPCKGCGRPIVWAITPDGKRIPLDPTSAVYRTASVNGVQMAFRANGREGPVANDGGTHLVSHFCTCRAASQFSGKNRDPQPRKERDA